MRVIGVIEADLETSGIGTSSRLGERLCDVPVLRRTVQRVLGSGRIDGLHVVTGPDQRPAIADLLAGLEVKIETHDAPPPIWRDRVTAGRKWSLGGWRGGVGGACALDEGFHPAVVGALAGRESANAVVWVPAGAALIDPGLIEKMIEHFVEHGEKSKLVFAQTPPGLSPVIWEASVLRDLGGMKDAPGRLLAYLPEEPTHDIVVSDCCYKVSAEVTHTAGRFLSDTRRGMELLGAVLQSADESDEALCVEAVCRWQRAGEFGECGSLPREVELELTTGDPLAGSALRPRGTESGDRGSIKTDLVERLVQELSGYDDSLLVLGGFGEPLLHPEFETILRLCRPRASEEGGVYGLALRTNAIALTSEVIEALLGARVDVISLLLDATSEATYRAVHGADYFETVRGNVETLLAARERDGNGLPLVVPEMVKVSETMGEMEKFFDEWTRRVGWANLEAFNSGAGQRADRSVMEMAPPSRRACGRLWSRCLVLADGRVVRCDQDYRGADAIGDVTRTSLADVWSGEAMSRIRGAHRDGCWSKAGLCATCHEWHRP